MAWFWIISGSAAAGAIVVFTRSWQRRTRSADLGAVSDQWVAENRLSQTPDNQR